MKTNVIGKHKTSIKTDNNGFTNVIYHNTSVVSFKPGHIILSQTVVHIILK